jgi:ribonucleotide reductase alpha subunit
MVSDEARILRIQKDVNNAVSKTVNPGTESLPSHVGIIYRQAHKAGCKQVADFQYASRSEGVL